MPPLALGRASTQLSSLPSRVMLRTTSCGRSACLLDDAGRVERLDERLARAVAAGHFGFVDPHFAIVDLQSGQRGHDVLDHFDADAAARQRRAARRFDAIGHDGRNAGGLSQVAAHEHDARCRVAAGRNSTCTSRPLQKPNPSTEPRWPIVRCCRSACIKRCFVESVLNGMERRSKAVERQELRHAGDHAGLTAGWRLACAECATAALRFNSARIWSVMSMSLW